MIRGNGNEHPDPNLTDERLRSWLDGNQAARERLCLALLALDPRFKHVQPRHPKGGPDGSHDIEAVMGDGGDVWGAVSFRNHANDSKADVNWISSKFRKDLGAALAKKPELHAFVFLTNVDLTNSKRDELIAHAKRRGVSFCDVFTRERLRILLDSPEGLGYRSQYLCITMSEAEQSAFFARWGTAIEQAIQATFSSIGDRLNRVEFLQEATRPLRYIRFQIDFKRPVGIVDTGEFRVLFSIESLFSKVHDVVKMTLEGCSFKASAKHPDALCGDFVNCKVWMTTASSRKPKQITGGGLFGMGEKNPLIQAHSGLAFTDPPSDCTLTNLHGTRWGICMTQPFAKLVSRIRVVANHYEIIDISSQSFSLEKMPNGISHSWPIRARRAESDHWVYVKALPPSSQWIDFSSQTPRRTIKAAPDWNFVFKSVE